MQNEFVKAFAEIKVVKGLLAEMSDDWLSRDAAYRGSVHNAGKCIESLSDPKFREEASGADVKRMVTRLDGFMSQVNEAAEVEARLSGAYSEKLTVLEGLYSSAGKVAPEGTNSTFPHRQYTGIGDSFRSAQKRLLDEASNIGETLAVREGHREDNKPVPMA
jgi:hypothetical protein